MSTRTRDASLSALPTLAAVLVAAAPPARDAASRPSTERKLRLPEKPYRYADVELPAHFTTRAARRFDNTPRDNPITDAGVTLGRVLFYDTLPKLVEVLAADERYPELFRKAFGDREVTPKRVGRAMAKFLRSMTSYQSRYDEGLAKTLSVRDDFENFTAQENRGKTRVVAQ